MKKTKQRKYSILAAILAAAVLVGIPVSAGRSWLDVSAGDRYSYYTYKDAGAEWENYYYVTTDTYIGYPVMAHSMSQTGQYGSAFTMMETGRNSYWYGTTDAPGGINYRLEAGPSSLSGAGWRLTGYYTP